MYLTVHSLHHKCDQNNKVALSLRTRQRRGVGEWGGGGGRWGGEREKGKATDCIFISKRETERGSSMEKTPIRKKVEGGERGAKRQEGGSGTGERRGKHWRQGGALWHGVEAERESGERLKAIWVTLTLTYSQSGGNNTLNPACSFR